jgi:NADH:ubiquinone oxidoreductase subunit 4 (subunit M)
MLLIGVPGSYSFISEFYIFYGLLGQNFLLVLLIALAMILLALAVLHSLQKYIFCYSEIKNMQLDLPISVHILCCSSIALSVFNGIYPQYFLSALSNLTGVY